MLRASIASLALTCQALAGPARAGDRSSAFYAESWALVHDLALGAPERRGQLNRLVTLMERGMDESDARHELLGDLDALSRELRAYVHRNKMPFRKRPREEAGEAARASARRLPAAEVLALRGGVLLSGRRAGEGRALVEEALTRDPGLVEAKEAMGIAAMAAGDSETAEKWLTRADESGKASFFTQYALALVAFARKGPEASALAEARFRESIRLNPLFAPAFTGLAGVLAARGGARAEAVKQPARLS
jgi:hypothetical protein